FSDPAIDIGARYRGGCQISEHKQGCNVSVAHARASSQIALDSPAEWHFGVLLHKIVRRIRHWGHSQRSISMCDYSLEHLASRPAKVGDKLVTTGFHHSRTIGFCAVGAPNMAVCLQPGTELAFERDIELPSLFWRARKLGTNIARFRRVNEGCR